MTVKVVACAALCNMVLDFSPVKKTLLDSGVVAILVRHTAAQSAELRINAVWALKNVLYQAEPAIKDAVMRELTYSRLRAYAALPFIMRLRAC